MQKAMRKEKPAAAQEHHAFDLRTALDWLREQGDLIETDKTVDPDLEVTGLQKHMDGGCPVLFRNVKGKPNHRVLTNLFGDMKVINKMFGWQSDAERVKKLAYALGHPLKSVESRRMRRRARSTSSRRRTTSTSTWWRSGIPPTSPS